MKGFLFGTLAFVVLPWALIVYLALLTWQAFH